MNEQKKFNIPIYLGLCLLTFSVLSFEVTVNRMFSLMFWHHFAFLIISVALFGIGFGSMLAFFFGGLLKKQVSLSLFFLSLLLAAALPLAVVFINRIPLDMDLVGTSPEHNKMFIQVFLLLSAPFVFVGFISALLFRKFKEDINKIYFFDLLGGGIGCVATLFLFPHRGPFIMTGILSVLIVVSACLFLFRKSKPAALVLLPLLVCALVFFVIPKIKDNHVRVNKSHRSIEIKENQKQTSMAIKNYGTMVYSDWGNSGFVAVFSNSPNRKRIIANYACFTYLIRVNPEKDVRDLNYGFYMDHDYPYFIKNKPENVGIVGVGGGKDVIQALARGARNVYGAELNKTIYDLYRHRYKDFLGGIPERTNVHVVDNEGRFLSVPPK